MSQDQFIDINDDEGGDLDCELDEWLPCEDMTGGSLFVVGTIAGDRKQRFADGTLMTTSLIRGGLSELVEGGVIATLNSRYLLRRRSGKPSLDTFLYVASVGGRCLDRENRPISSFEVTGARART